MAFNFFGHIQHRSIRIQWRLTVAMSKVALTGTRGPGVTTVTKEHSPNRKGTRGPGVTTVTKIPDFGGINIFTSTVC